MGKIQLAGVLFLSVFLLVDPMYADFEEDLKKLAGKNAKSYVAPVVTSLGTGLNSGVYRTADVHSLLGFDVSFNLTPVTLPDEAATYSFELPNITFNIPNPQNSSNPYEIVLDGNTIYPAADEVPTIFGEKGSKTLPANTSGVKSEIEDQLAEDGMSSQVINSSEVQGEINTAINTYVTDLSLPGGLGVVDDIGYFGALSAQASVGLPFGTEAQVRYLPTYSLGDYGDFGMIGFGARLDIDQFIPVPFFPVDIAAGAFYQSMKLGPLTMNSNIIHAEVSKSIPMLTVYGGVGMESTTMNVDYTLENTGTPALDGTDVSFELKGDNSFRTTVGARIKLLVLSINADYSIGEYNSANLGVGITFR